MQKLTFSFGDTVIF